MFPVECNFTHIILYFIGKRPLVDKRKKTFELCYMDTETDSQKRDTLLNKLKDHIPNVVAIQYW